MDVAVSAVVPVWNGRRHLERLLQSIARQTCPIGETIVVDNGSSDGAADVASGWGARVVRFETNCGFAAAVNRGVRECGGQLIAILNSDVELAPEWTAHLVKALAGRHAWFATGLILSARDSSRIDGTWDLTSAAAMPWRAGAGAGVHRPEFQTAREIALAPFTAILLKRELWDRVAPLDERFESYLEDVDFGLRCQKIRCAGVYQPEAICRHWGSATLGAWHRDSVRRMSRNQIFLVRKHWPGKLWWRIFAGQLLWGLLAARHGHLAAWLAGKWQGLTQACPSEGPRLPVGFLNRQEKEILDLQSTLGPDTYWRWYARLTGQAMEAKRHRSGDE